MSKLPGVVRRSWQRRKLRGVVPRAWQRVGFSYTIINVGSYLIKPLGDKNRTVSWRTQIVRNNKVKITIFLRNIKLNIYKIFNLEHQS